MSVWCRCASVRYYAASVEDRTALRLEEGGPGHGGTVAVQVSQVVAGGGQCKMSRAASDAIVLVGHGASTEGALCLSRSECSL